MVRLEEVCKGADTVDGPWCVCCIKRPVKGKVRRGRADQLWSQHARGKEACAQEVIVRDVPGMTLELCRGRST